MESEPGRAPNSTTERMVDRREEYAVMCVGGGLYERMTRYITGVWQREGQCVSRRVLCSVRSVGGGFATEVGWRCAGAGERRWWKMVLLEVPGWRSPRNEWSAGSVAEPSADKETSSDTSALMSGANQSRSSEVLSCVQLARGGLRVQGDDVSTGKNSTGRNSMVEGWGRRSSRDGWSAGSVAEPSADKETSRDTSALMSGANHSRSSKVLSSV